MAIKEEMSDGKKVYMVTVDGTDAKGNRVQRKRRGITSYRELEKFEFELKRELAAIREQAPSYKWEEWFAVCMDRMKVEYKATTLLNYTGKSTHWIMPHWEGKDIKSITPPGRS